MPDRRSFFQRVWDFVRRPPEEPRAPPELPGGTGPPIPPVPPGSPVDQGPREPPDAPFRRIWDDEASYRVTRDVTGRTGYSRNEQFQVHTEILVSLGTEEPRSVQLRMWEDYIDAFINGTTRHEEFLERWNIDPADFDWQLWREVMGY